MELSTVWHLIHIFIVAYVKNKRAAFGFALIGLFGNLVLAKLKRDAEKVIR